MPKHFQTFMKDMKDMKDKIITFTIGKHLAQGLNNLYRKSCKKYLHILHKLHFPLHFASVRAVNVFLRLAQYCHTRQKSERSDTGTRGSTRSRWCSFRSGLNSRRHLWKSLLALQMALFNFEICSYYFHLGYYFQDIIRYKI